MNNSYAIVGSHLLAAATKRGTTPIVYHPSNLGFRHPRQFHELVSIANQWRWFDDVQDTWASVSGIIEEVCLARSSACCLVYVSATLHPLCANNFILDCVCFQTHFHINANATRIRDQF